MLVLSVVVAVASLSAQDAPDKPEAWTRRYEEAGKAIKAGSLARAELILTEVVGEAEKLGPDDLRVAEPLEVLAGFYLDKKQKRYDAADPLIRRALKIREKAQRAEHPDTATTISMLAMCRLLAKGKDADSAGPMLKRALEVLVKAKGEKDIEVAGVLHRLALFHLSHGEYAEAEGELMRAVQIREALSKLESDPGAELLDDLGDVHTAMASRLDIKALEKEIEAEAADAPKPAETEVERHGRLAEEYYRRGLAVREKVLKPDDPDIAESLFNLGQLAFLRGRPADGEGPLDRWLALQEKAKAPDDEKRAKVLFMLAGAAMERKDFPSAERLLLRAQEIEADREGAESKEVAALLGMRALVATEARRFEDAERLIKQGLDAQAALQGADNADVAEAKALTAGSFKDRSRDRLAPVFWRRLKKLAERAGGEHGHDELKKLVEGYIDLLRRTNEVVPKPTEEDLAYLKKAGIVDPSTDIHSLAETDHLFDELDDEALAHVERLYEVESLSLRGRSIADDKPRKPITDAGLAHLKGLINLRRIYASNTAITDAGLAHLGGLENLEELFVGFNPVGDAGLTHLKGLKNLRELKLPYTNVTDASLEVFRSLPNLRELDLTNTRVTQEGVHALRRERPGLSIEYRPGEGYVEFGPPPATAPLDDAPPEKP
ncbi:tetratricopeptide repeat protein [Aquisphaera insulae]|uniref:tetratricopeptide repeat protein n=1 Tax=Aquisphaera insulae TaxID=2712864 RepID=UPI0013EB666D|nr:tetratricopeptide repeat protein [Aquisphaera insulae]